MSYFNHETFGAGHMPPFETIFDIKQKKNSLRSTISETIEDVEFEDITDEQPKDKEAPKWDKTARKKEIWDEAMKQADEIKINDARLTISHAILFEIGASWADQNPLSHFKSEFNRIEAFSDAMDKKLEDLKKEGEKVGTTLDYRFDLLLFVTAHAGMLWATKNPPKYY